MSNAEAVYQKQVTFIALGIIALCFSLTLCYYVYRCCLLRKRSNRQHDLRPLYLPTILTTNVATAFIKPRSSSLTSYSEKSKWDFDESNSQISIPDLPPAAVTTCNAYPRARSYFAFSQPVFSSRAHMRGGAPRSPSLLPRPKSSPLPRSTVETLFSNNYKLFPVQGPIRYLVDAPLYFSPRKVSDDAAEKKQHDEECM